MDCPTCNIDYHITLIGTCWCCESGAHGMDGYDPDDPNYPGDPDDEE